MSNNLQGVNVYDDKIINKTGLGCGCDITQVIGAGNCKTQILDYSLLKQAGGVELDNTQESLKIYRTGKDYSSMSKEVNTILAGKMGFDLKVISFGFNLDASLKSATKQTDIYEYGMTMIIQKKYALNIKPGLYSHLKDFVGVLAWNDISGNADPQNKTNKDAIKQLFKKYGTHISTKAFYGCMYEYFLYREQNDWESSMEAQLKLSSNANVPIPDTGLTVSGGYSSSITDTDEECYKLSKEEYTINRVGGDVNIQDLEQWLTSCTTDKPETCALLGYKLSMNDADDSGLIPLYELLDPSDTRYIAMKDAYNEYLEENSIKLKEKEMVIVDAYAKHFGDSKQAKDYLYDIDGNHHQVKYFKLPEDIYSHVKGAKKGKTYFYYALGHLTDNAVVDIKFAENSDIDGDWQKRGCNSNEGVTGCLKDRYLAVKIKNIKNNVPVTDFVKGFGVNVDGKVKSISKGTTTSFNWLSNPDTKDWYSSGLIHDDVKCIYTKDKLLEF